MLFKPHNYQKYAIKQIIQKHECGLFLDMGLGKTVCTLTAINTLMYETFEISKVLVIATKRVALNTWTSEVDKWDHLRHLTVARVLGTEKQRFAALAEEKDIYVINRENVTWLVDTLNGSWPFDMIVIDELSSFKNPKAKRFRSLRKVRPLSKRVVGLTGTPAANGYMDLWAEMYLLDRGERLGRTIGGYRNRYFYPGKRNGYVVFSWDLKEGADEVIMDKISDICVSMKSEDYISLPDRTINDIKVELSPKEKRMYYRMEKTKVLELEGQEVTAFAAAALYNKLLQMANGAVYDEEGEYIHIHDQKIDALDEILEASQGQPVLVFYSYRHDLDRLRQAFKEYEPRTLDSEKDIRDWNEGRIPLMLAHPASAGHGLNLQAGGHIIVWFGLNWSLELYQQANARLHRQGQSEGVIIHRLIASGTVDEIVAKRLESKEDMQDELMEYLTAKL